jgi:hypothetical protein
MGGWLFAGVETPGSRRIEFFRSQSSPSMRRKANAGPSTALRFAQDDNSEKTALYSGWKEYKSNKKL